MILHRGLGFSLLLAVGCGPKVETGTIEDTDGTVDSQGGSTEPGETPPDPTAAGTGTGGVVVPGSPTYHRDVRPLVERHCVSCHSEGNIGPFELRTYEDVHAVRELVVATIESGTMPPWGMDPDCDEFIGDPSLTPEDKDMIAQWVDGGAPEGDPGDFVALPPLAQPELSRTDYTLQLPEPYEPQLAPDDYRCFILDWPGTETTFITGYLFEPDNTSITHHAIVYGVSPDRVAEFEALDADEPGPGYTCFGGPGGSAPFDFLSSPWIGVWAPGTRVGDLPEGTGLRMEPGSKIVLQMHYNTLAANGQPDQSKLHYKVDPSVDREAVMMPWANPEWIGGGMSIPAGTDDTIHVFQFDPTSIIDLMTDVIEPGQPLEMFRVIHHMHRRGSRGVQSIVHSDGSTECLANIPRYDYDWQMSYRYTESKILEPGDQLYLECQWDNSTNDQNVNWGDGTDDEMCLAVHYVTAAL